MVMAPKKRKADPTRANDEGITKEPRITPPTTKMCITRNMKIDGPRQATFNTAELLETILLDLPMNQLFTIRRASKKFRDCVNQSFRLQEKRFLRPSKREKEIWTLCLLSPSPGPSLSLEKGLEFVPSVDGISSRVEHVGPKTPVRLNGCVATNLNLNMPALERATADVRDEFSIDLKRFIMKDRSFKAVYLTDPPCTHLNAVFNFTLNTVPQTKAFTDLPVEIVNPAGVTLGQLLSAAIERKHEIRVNDLDTSKFDEYETSMAEIISQRENVKRKRGSIILNAFLYATFKDDILPTEAEWAEVRRKSKAI